VCRSFSQPRHRYWQRCRHQACSYRLEAAAGHLWPATLRTLGAQQEALRNGL
jgi:hypothetical protein